MTTLALRHEGQLQPMAQTDSFVIFFQMNSNCVVGNNGNSAKNRAPSTQFSGIQQLAQVLLERMLKIAQAQWNLDIWKEARNWWSSQRQKRGGSNAQACGHGPDSRQSGAMVDPALSTLYELSLSLLLQARLRPHAQKEQSGYLAREGLSRPYAKKVIASWLLGLRLQNHPNQCYQNATVISMLWSLARMLTSMYW